MVVVDEGDKGDGFEELRPLLRARRPMQLRLHPDACSGGGGPQCHHRLPRQEQRARHCSVVAVKCCFASAVPNSAIAGGLHFPGPLLPARFIWLICWIFFPRTLLPEETASKCAGLWKISSGRARWSHGLGTSFSSAARSAAAPSGSSILGLISRPTRRS